MSFVKIREIRVFFFPIRVHPCASVVKLLLLCAPLRFSAIKCHVPNLFRVSLSHSAHLLEKSACPFHHPVALSFLSKPMINRTQLPQSPQNANPLGLSYLGFIWDLLFGIWNLFRDLGFGIWSFSGGRAPRALSRGCILTASVSFPSRTVLTRTILKRFKFSNYLKHCFKRSKFKTHRA